MCTGCKESGVNGYNCNLPCPINCQDLRGVIVSGTCLGCTAGWMKEFCNKCKITFVIIQIIVIIQVYCNVSWFDDSVALPEQFEE
jgi:hypothetical protein